MWKILLERKVNSCPLVVFFFLFTAQSIDSFLQHPPKSVEVKLNFTKYLFPARTLVEVWPAQSQPSHAVLFPLLRRMLDHSYSYVLIILISTCIAIIDQRWKKTLFFFFFKDWRSTANSYLETWDLYCLLRCIFPLVNILESLAVFTTNSTLVLVNSHAPLIIQVCDTCIGTS